MPYYAIANGRKICVTDNWDECKQLVSAYKNAKYKKFDTITEATKYITPKDEQEDKINDNIPIIKSDQEYFVYTDGGCSNNGRSNASAGIGIYFGENDPRNVSKKITGSQTNNAAELRAIFEAFKIIESDLKLGKKITIVTDSEYAIKCVTSYGAKCNALNWVNDIPNKELVREVYNNYTQYSNVSFMHINSHTNKTDIHSIGNACADKLAIQYL